MKARPFILQIVAALMIFVFSQKIGAGLFLHNLFHDSVDNNKIHEQGNEKGNITGYKCTCIEDFLMPFEEAREPNYFQPVSNYTIAFTFFQDIIPYTSILPCLRGPPECTT